MTPPTQSDNGNVSIVAAGGDHHGYCQGRGPVAISWYKLAASTVVEPKIKSLPGDCHVASLLAMTWKTHVGCEGRNGAIPADGRRGQKAALLVRCAKSDAEGMAHVCWTSFFCSRRTNLGRL